jgi:hypothetical protein
MQMSTLLEQAEGQAVLHGLSPDMERLVGRVILDKDFREYLITNPERAIKEAGFALTPEEIAGVIHETKNRGNDTQTHYGFDAVAGSAWD